MRTPVFIIIACLAFCCHAAQAQTQTILLSTPNAVGDFVADSILLPPKIGLTLSGGGVKGLAHIGVLRLIDSLDIRIDCISATSMGSVVGALYAMGYSGDDIKRIALTEIAWWRMLSNAPIFYEVAFEEKDEFGRYAFELPMTGFKPSAPSAFIEGQYILSLFNYYAYNARGIRHFSELPIPIRMMGSDILNGGSVRLDSGSLPIAMRASMAIPVIYTPIFFQDKLIVDGGLDNNFAVDEVRAMGATQVIGSYTGFRVYQKNEISSPGRLLAQTYAFGSVKEANEQMKKATVVINHMNGLKRYSTTDFMHYADIIRVGEEEAQKMLPQLRRIAYEQHRLGIRRAHKKMVDPQLPIQNIQFLTAENEPVHPSVARFSAARLGLDTGKIYTADQIRDATKQLYGSRFFDNVYLEFDSTKLNVHLKDKETDHLKAAVHYDSYSSIGIILNYTARQIGLPNSRLVLTADISERLKARANYQWYISNKYHVWVKPFYNYENTSGKEALPQYKDNQNYSASHHDYGVGIGYSVKVNSGFFLNVHREHDVLRRNRSLVARYDDIPTHAYDHAANVVQLNWTRNRFNHVFFPTRGSRTSIDVAWTYNNTLKLNILALEGAADSIDFERLVAPHAGQFVPKQVGKFLLRHKSVVPITPKIALVTSFAWGGLWDAKSGDSLYLSDSKKSGGANRYVFLSDRLYIGGARLQNRDNRINFVGLRPGEVAAYSNMTTVNVGIQWMPTRQLFLTPSVSYGFANPRGFNPLSGFGRSNFHIFGYGLNAAYKSPIGPVIATVEYGNGLWRTYLAIGFPF